MMWWECEKKAKLPWCLIQRACWSWQTHQSFLVVWACWGSSFGT